MPFSDYHKFNFTNDTTRTVASPIQVSFVCNNVIPLVISFPSFVPEYVRNITKNYVVSQGSVHFHCIRHLRQDTIKKTKVISPVVLGYILTTVETKSILWEEFSTSRKEYLDIMSKAKQELELCV